MEQNFRIGICQMNVVDDKRKNIGKAEEMVRAAAQNDASVVILPEMFNCPYANSKFAAYAEEIETGETIRAMAKIASELGIYLVAGSIPEREGEKVFNTSLIYDRHGSIIGKHRKMHLFDIDIPGGVSFRESDTLTPGEQFTVVDTEFCKLGVAICYDLRFPEIMRLMVLNGAKVILVPAAFNMTTGPAHWEPLIKVRAIDNQVFLAAVSPARDESAAYVAYGNSMLVDPWGNILCRADEKEEIVYADIDLKYLDKVRRELPLLKHRRQDLYDVGK